MSYNKLETITENWAKLISIVGKIENSEVREGATKMCNDLHDKFAVCPASTRIDYVGCFTGGLVWHSLNVLKAMKNIRSSFGLENKVHSDSMIILGLFHDIGKLGNHSDDYYLPQASEWHRNKGMLFEVNREIANVPVAVRSLWWLNQYGIPLSENEVHAILSLANSHNEEIRFVPSLKDPWETFLLQTSVRGACIAAHGITELPNNK
jgi:hypothetical protein